MPESVSNPYAVTTGMADAGEEEENALAPGEEIRFSGAASREDLYAFLKSHDHVGIWGAVQIAFVVICVASIILVVGGLLFLLPFLAILGGFLIATATSSTGYRRSVFVETHPDWDQPFVATVNSSGMSLIDKYGVEVFTSWQYAASISESDSVIVIEWSLPRESTTILSPAMTEKLGDWDKVRAHLKTLTAPKEVELRRSQSERNAGRLVGDRTRQRSVEVPISAVALVGRTHPISMDLREHRRAFPKRTYRANVLRLALTACIAMFIIGICIALPLPLLFRIGIAIFGILYFTKGLWRDLWQTDGPIQSQPDRWILGFADEAGILLDFRNHKIRYPWNALTEITPESSEAIYFRVGDDENRSAPLLRIDRLLTETKAEWEKLRSLVGR